jgi:hypothetical protein
MATNDTTVLLPTTASDAAAQEAPITKRLAFLARFSLPLLYLPGAPFAAETRRTGNQRRR